MSYSKSEFAKELGVSPQEVAKRAKAAGFDSTEDYYNSLGGPAWRITEAIKNELVALDRQLHSLGPLSLSDEEIETFLNKAIQEVQPYYDRKSEEINTQLAEGKIRTAEDQLFYIQNVEQEIGELFQHYDLSTAQTEEEFANRLGALTSRTEDEIESKTYDWKQRIEDVKFNQIQQGIFSSGIGGEKRQELAERKETEVGNIQQRSQEQQTELDTARKYDIENIRLARESAQQRRIQQIGTPEETERLKQDAMSLTGGPIGPQADLARQRAERGIAPIYNTQALTDLEEERRGRVLSRHQELQDTEKAIRDETFNKQREQILAERAKKQSQLKNYGIYA